MAKRAIRLATPPSAGRITASTVARAAGVSISAVSRTYTEGASVSAKTRDRVLAAAARLGYKPNMLARGLMTRQTKLIGILVANFQNPAYLHILDLFTQAIQRRGLHSLIINVAQCDDLSEAVEMVMPYQVDGLIVTSSTLSPALAAECARRRTPVVIFGRYAKDAPVPAVCCDNIQGGRMVADLLLERGYRRLAFIGGPPEVSTTIDRGKGFTERLLERGCDAWRIEIGGEYSYDAGYAAVERLLRAAVAPDALFCADDIIAFGALDAARYQFGLQVPGQLGVVGFDDILLADSGAYSLTTIRQPFPQMVAGTVEALVERIEDRSPITTVRFLPGALIERASVRAAPTNL